jgi:hypothetical protein
MLLPRVVGCDVLIKSDTGDLIGPIKEQAIERLVPDQRLTDAAAVPA